MAKSGAQEAKERAQAAQKAKNDMDYRSYMRDYEDVSTFYKEASKDGILKGENSYTKKYGKNTDGWENTWVKGMNKAYGTENTDVGQFSKDQFAKYHYDTYGKKENRKINENTDYQQSFENPHASYKERQAAFNKAGMEAMGDAYKKDISQYNFESHGHKTFDMQDVRALRKAGYDDDAIAKYSSSLDKSKLGEGIRHNHAKFAGQHATTGFDKSKGIESFDVGKGFNAADVKFLQGQGYSDKEISAYANKSVKEGGKSHGRWMADYMHQHGQLDYMHGAWKNAREKAQAAGGGKTDNSTNDSFNTNDICRAPAKTI